LRSIENRLLNLESQYKDLLHTKVTITYGDGTAEELILEDAVQYFIDNMGSEELRSVVSIMPENSCLDILLVLSNPVPNRNMADFSQEVID